MFRKIEDFVGEWEYEAEQMLLVLRALTDTALTQEVAPEARTLGRLAWHITQSIPEMMGRVGLSIAGPSEDAPVPPRAQAIADAYEQAASQLGREIQRAWTDDSLLEERDMYGERWMNGMTLEILIRHQAHHRGQMTVLMRQAGLKVPGVYGPAREDWVQYGMSAPVV